MATAPEIQPNALIEHPAANNDNNELFVEQVRLLFETRGVIAIGLVIAGLSAAAAWRLLPVWMVGAWFALYFLVVLGRLSLCHYQRQAADRDATARKWCWRFVAGTSITGILWGAFGCFVLMLPDAVYHVFAVFVLGGVIAGSMIGNTTYLPAFYSYMVPAALPAIVIMITRPDPIRIEMGVMLALFIAVLAVVGSNLNRSVLSEIRLRIAQGNLLERQGTLFDKLSKSEALMEEAQAIAHVGHWEFNQTANSFAASKEAYDIYGVDPATFQASLEMVIARVHPDDKVMAAEDFKQAMANHTSFRIEHRIVLDDGVVKFVHVAGKVFFDAERKTVYSVGTVQDITSRHAFETQLQFANSLQSAELEASPDGIMVVDADDRIISYNQRFATMWGVPPQGLATGDHAPVLAAVVAVMREPEKFLARVRYFYAHPLESGEDELETLRGQFIERYTAGLRTDSGQSVGRVWFFRDITARRRAETLLLHSARLDALTGLANRAIAVVALQRAITESKRGGKTFALFYIDLDHFKDVNDTLGHPVGDALLCAVAGRLQSNAREADTVARFGGDEFAIVAEGIHEPVDAGVLAEKLLSELGKPYLIQGNTIRIGASVGIDFHGPEAPDAESLLSHADIALYRAKSEGRGGYRFFTSAMDAEVRTRVTMGAELRNALVQDQFFLVYQPQATIDTGHIVGVEALVRWRHPKRGVVEPQEFIPVAERFGLIRELDHWVLWNACRQAKAWLLAGIAPLRMSVNLSGLEFKASTDLENDILAALAETGLPPTQLELELTETVLMDSSLKHADVFQRLRQRGITIAIDDFGTGYSSLGYLGRFPCDRIKIAQEFVKGLPSCSESVAIVKATIGLGHDLGIMVIAEGVETREQLDLLNDWGCREVQGYYYSKPLASTDLLPLLSGSGIIRVEGHTSGIGQVSSRPGQVRQMPSEALSPPAGAGRPA
ncbi:MAG: EAL domain-containing protein [Bryobacteraceae bacterium]